MDHYHKWWSNMQKYKYYDEIILCYDRLPVLHYKGRWPHRHMLSMCGRLDRRFRNNRGSKFWKTEAKKWDLGYRSTALWSFVLDCLKPKILKAILRQKMKFCNYWEPKSNNWRPLRIESNGKTAQETYVWRPANVQFRRGSSLKHLQIQYQVSECGLFKSCNKGAATVS